MLKQLKFTAMKFFPGHEDNFDLETESRAIELGIKREMTISDLSEEEKNEFFAEFYDRPTFDMEDALELTR
jgi:hypothetical protein